MRSKELVMHSYDSIIENYTNFLKNELFEAKKINDIDISVPLDRSFFSEDLLRGDWPTLNNEAIEDEDVFALKEAAIKKLFYQFTNLNEKQCVLGFTVVMDFCHTMKYDEADNSAKNWAFIFFELFRLALGFLKVPSGLLHFWPYVDSRLSWFKEGLSVESQYGRTNLSAIKAPFSKVVFQLNKMLQSMQLHSKLLCPSHYKLAMKMHWFLAQCLSPNEQANTNKRGNIAKEMPEKLWEKDDLDHHQSGFSTHWHEVQQNILQDPIRWAFSDRFHQQAFEKPLTYLLDEILKQESDFYSRIKRVKSEYLRASRKPREEIPEKLQIKLYEVEKKDTLKTISDSKVNFWREVYVLQESLETSLRPLPLEYATWNTNEVLAQLRSPYVDFYRKSFVLQVLFTFNLIEAILSDESVSKFYQAQMAMPGQSTDIPSETKYSETLDFCRHLIKDRIANFYDFRDKEFSQVIKSALQTEKLFMRNKISRGSKQLSDFEYLEEPFGTLSKPDHSFKKFGWILLGNKKIDKVWKIKTGLDQIKNNHPNPKDLYITLKEEHDNSTDGKGTVQLDESIVKQWQYLRSLKSDFLFDFHKVDESTGINGLFEDSLIKRSKEKKKNLRLHLEDEEREKHAKKLQEARSYFQNKDQKKREAEDELSTTLLKKSKAENEASPNIGSSQNEFTEQSSPSVDNSVKTTDHERMNGEDSQEGTLGSHQEQKKENAFDTGNDETPQPTAESVSVSPINEEVTASDPSIEEKDDLSERQDA